MATVKESPFGILNGKVGQVVGFTWKGMPVVRVYSKISNPRTDKQETQRQKWGVTMRFLQPL